jgi:hypothetical protein
MRIAWLPDDTTLRYYPLDRRAPSLYYPCFHPLGYFPKDLFAFGSSAFRSPSAARRHHPAVCVCERAHARWRRVKDDGRTERRARMTGLRVRFSSVCVGACVRACLCACVRACVCLRPLSARLSKLGQECATGGGCGGHQRALCPRYLIFGGAVHREPACVSACVRACLCAFHIGGTKGKAADSWKIGGFLEP